MILYLHCTSYNIAFNNMYTTLISIYTYHLPRTSPLLIHHLSFRVLCSVSHNPSKSPSFVSPNLLNVPYDYTLSVGIISSIESLISPKGTAQALPTAPSKSSRLFLIILFNESISPRWASTFFSSTSLRC